MSNADYKPLQSAVFGHRFKANQSFYEYILEFLIVVFSEKSFKGKKLEGLFPIGINVNDGIQYSVKNKAGLKRFIFFEKSKLEGRFNLDKKAYEYHLELLKEQIEIEDDLTYLNKDLAVELIQDLLYGFSAVLENRSWFAQSMLPICRHALMPEIMGTKGKRSSDYDVNDEKFKEDVDSLFQTNRYNFMARGGEVYYLHILSALNNNPQYKEEIEKGFNILINQFQELERLCENIQRTWIDKAEIEEEKTIITKTLGYIPAGFTNREEKTLIELMNILNSEMHPFEKIETLANGIIFQIIIMCYDQARNTVGKNRGYLIFDVNCFKGKSNEEVKKIAAMNYQQYEQDLLDALYGNVVNFRNKDKSGKEKSEQDTIKEAIDDSIKVYKKLGKRIGVIRPINDKSIRFTLNEEILKYLVISLVKPNSKMTFDRFLDKLYLDYGIIIGNEQLSKIDKRYSNIDLSFLEINKKDLQVMLKDSGFLRELSDSTSIVENPYMEV
ncbi:hypothetical protein [Clostridium celatum]|uniref:hypothetical protein n=1 Tax=Clostridium celatum TaxID=36834 RepID=UPI001898445E|nr:hypothetical protein [Clostridium celatum]